MSKGFRTCFSRFVTVGKNGTAILLDSLPNGGCRVRQRSAGSVKGQPGPAKVSRVRQRSDGSGKGQPGQAKVSQGSMSNEP